jgi:metal-sulfur cluster biosynthetic enzyme
MTLLTGRAKPGWVGPAREDATPEELRLWNALEEVVDPEYPVSVVDMGLIYGLQFQDRRVMVHLTFTSMGCPAMEFIVEDIRGRLLQEVDVDAVELDIVWDPPWTRERLSDRAIEKLQYWGIRA